jgi:hypothetical protein
MKVSLLAPLLLSAVLMGCGGGGGDAAVLENAAVREASDSAATVSQVVSQVPTPSKAPPAQAPGYNDDGTLSPVVRDSMQHETVTWQPPPSQNARGFSLEDWHEWNASCDAQPQCQIPWEDVEAYNRDVCEAHYPEDAGCPIGRPRD